VGVAIGTRSFGKATSGSRRDSSSSAKGSPAPKHTRSSSSPLAIGAPGKRPGDGFKKVSVEEELEERLSQHSKSASGDEEDTDPEEDAELHAERVIGIAQTEDEEGKGWDVDAQGWQFGDNHWEK